MASPLVQSAPVSLQPVQIPSSPLSVVSPALTAANLSPHDVISVVFTITFVIWVFYMAIAVYHWLRYGNRSWMMVPALAAHIIISGALMLFAVSGFQ